MTRVPPVFKFSAVVVSLCLLLIGTSSLRADEESEALARFKVPVEQAVEKALANLAKSQKEDGLFGGQYGDTTAVASLVGMAFLSKGYSPGLGPYGENINRSIDLVLKSEQEKDGKPSGYLVRTGHGKMYAHCISTLFLSEVSGMVDPARQERIDDVLPRAVSLIIDAQNVKKEERFSGGWRYEPHSPDADLSLTGWAVMALRSARLNGVDIPDDNIRRAIGFILTCQPKEAKGEKGFSYEPFQHGKAAMTGVGILCLSLTGQHQNEMLPRAGDFLLEQKVNNHWDGSHFFYEIYYCTQAMFQLGGKYWDTWATEFYENALSHQRDDGSWGDPYPTAMTVLAMTVSYRQLPVYQR
jgi:hypothetical protein